MPPLKGTGHVLVGQAFKMALVREVRSQVEILDLRGRKWRQNGEDCTVRSAKYCYGDQIKENEMSGTCSAHGNWEIYTKCLSENLKDSTTQKNWLQWEH